MSVFSNSLSHFYGIHAIRIRYSNSYIQQLHKSLTICLIVRSISIRVSDLQYLQELMMDILPKKFTQPIHPSTTTALPPSNLQWTQIGYVTSKPEPEPETRVWPFPNPKTRVYRRNPGLETLLAFKRCCFSNRCSDYESTNSVLRLCVGYITVWFSTLLSHI